MADKRAWFKMDVGYMTNPKIALVAVESVSAILMHVASMAYSAQHLTNGFVPVKLITRQAGGVEADVDLLTEAGLWHLDPTECESCDFEAKAGSAYVHDFLEFNRSAEGVKRVSSNNSAAAKARWDKEREAKRNAERMQDASEAHSETQSETAPDAMQREKREEIKETSEVADATTRPELENLLNILDACVEANGAKKPARNKKNMDAARLLVDKDGYSVDQVAWMIHWATGHEFWKSNILSMTKLRDKFDQLKLQAMKDKPRKPQVDFNGDIDIDAVLGSDAWVPGRPPEGLTFQEEIEWKKEQRRLHNEERLIEARMKLGVNRAA